MATRSIVTSQPDVACDVCQRRLLRGEHSDVFLAAGRRYNVCELCAPRATHEGWLRETEDGPLRVSAAPARRGRGLFERLRQTRRPPNGAPEPAADPAQGAGPAVPDFLEEFSGVAEERLGVGAQASRAERAIELFNAGEHPRRVAGVARSLGPPGVNVCPDEDVQHLVSIVIAWELCWYRYEVHLDDQDAPVRVLNQGTELDEIAHEDRLVNAVVDERGSLSLAAA